MNYIIVDDEAVIRRGLSKRIELLFPEWNNIGSFPCAEEALAWTGWETIDLLITDICMTGSNGIDLAQAAVEKNPELQIVFISGYLDFSYAQSAIQLKAVDYIVKPISDKQIMDTINRVNRRLEEKRAHAPINAYKQYRFWENYLSAEENLSEKDMGKLSSFVADLWILELYYLPKETMLEEFPLFSYKKTAGFQYCLYESGQERLLVYPQSAKALIGSLRKKLAQNAILVYTQENALPFDRCTTCYHQMKLQLEKELEQQDGARKFGITVNGAIRYIKEHYQSQISLSKIAEHLYVHPAYLSGQFKLETGKTVTEYICNYRILKAKELLRDPRNKIYWIAEQVGFNNQRYFSQVFKRIVGQTPAEYRNAVSQKTSDDHIMR